ncbi:MAG: macro domain-containing protein, partial [Conexibacteraceae bacterium]|nr:macro domain-containing protein [Conexibacteraceae bacterium]
RHVIHAVGPVWSERRAQECDALLGSCYRVSLRLATAHGLKSIAFPAISTGIYGFPGERAGRVAVAAVKAGLDAAQDPSREDGDDGRGGRLDAVVFCCFGGDSASHHRDAFFALGL